MLSVLKHMKELHCDFAFMRESLVREGTNARNVC